MGEFRSWMTDGRVWRRDEGMSAPWLRVTVHDSDVGVLEYRPIGPGSGVAYAGVAARTYFEDESIPATDKAREILGLLYWFHLVGRSHPTLGDWLEDLLVAEGEAAEDPLVEDSLGRFFAALGMPLPQ